MDTLLSYPVITIYVVLTSVWMGVIGSLVVSNTKPFNTQLERNIFVFFLVLFAWILVPIIFVLWVVSVIIGPKDYPKE